MNRTIGGPLSALLYTFAYLLGPIGVAAGFVIPGWSGTILSVLSMAAMSFGYVWASLDKAPATTQDAFVEGAFWFVVGWVVVFAMLTIAFTSRGHFLALFVTVGLALIIWLNASKSTRARIRRAPIV